MPYLPPSNLVVQFCIGEWGGAQATQERFTPTVTTTRNPVKPLIRGPAERRRLTGIQIQIPFNVYTQCSHFCSTIQYYILN